MVTRYVSGLCVAGLGLCGGGWLLVAAVAFGGQGGEAHRVNEATGAGLMLAACVTLVAWAVAWRRRMRADGVLGDRFLLVPKREARRNRRELAKDIRRTARQSKRAARQAKHETDQPDQPDQLDQPDQPGQLADDEIVEKPAYLGITVYEPAPTERALRRHALEGREPGPEGVSDTGLSDIGLSGTEVTRDTRRAARKAQRAARRAKAGAGRTDQHADNEFVDDNPYVGITVYEPAPTAQAAQAHAIEGREHGVPGLAGVEPRGPELTRVSLTGTELTATGPHESLQGTYQGGHDGASAVDPADVLDELRTLRHLLAPLLAGTGTGTELQPWVRSPHQQAAPAQVGQPERPEQAEPERSEPGRPEPERSERSEPERPEGPGPGTARAAGDDELLRVADTEEAWW